MADEADIAAKPEEIAWQNYYDAKRQTKKPIITGPKICECGEPIPQKRREGGYQNCIYCAQREERHGR